MEQRTFNTRCKLCDALGKVKVTPRNDGQVELIDLVKHRKNCSRYKGAREQPKHFRQKKWVQQEKRANALVGARETLMSGAVNEDGDGRVFHEWRVESKQTKTDKYRLTTHVWEKLCKGALMAGEEPLLHIEMGNLPTRVVLVRGDWVAPHNIDAQGMIEVTGKGATIKLGDLMTPMWIDGMSPTPWLLAEREFQELKRKADELNENSVRIATRKA